MQTVKPVGEEMANYIEAKRDWVRNHFTPEAINQYDSVSGKLTLLDTIIKSKWIEPNETFKLQSLGITLGDIIVQDLNFVWVEVDDEYGNTPAVQMPDTSLIVFPLTMISKRIETGEDVDIYDLYEGLVEKLNEIDFD
jgi:hypothetical protein